MLIRAHPEAKRERRKAYDHYAAESLSVAKRFNREVDLALDFVEAFPSGAPALLADIRGKTMARFPYTIFYRIQSDHIEIVAFAHHSRRPGYWTSRLR